LTPKCLLLLKAPAIAEQKKYGRRAREESFVTSCTSSSRRTKSVFNGIYDAIAPAPTAVDGDGDGDCDDNESDVDSIMQSPSPTPMISVVGVRISGNPSRSS